MKRKSLIVFMLVAVLSFMLLSTPARAGSKQSHRWEGVAMGIGAAILGSTLYNLHKNYTECRPAPRPRHAYRHPRPRHHRDRGHWEVRREWVPPTFKRAWNPGHYDRRGRWVPGHWIEIEDRPGYWSETRVWVSRR